MNNRCVGLNKTSRTYKTLQCSFDLCLTSCFNAHCLSTRSNTDSTGVLRLLATRGDGSRSSGTEIDSRIEVSLTFKTTFGAMIGSLRERQICLLVSAVATRFT